MFNSKTYCHAHHNFWGADYVSSLSPRTAELIYHKAFHAFCSLVSAVNFYADTTFHITQIQEIQVCTHQGLNMMQKPPAGSMTFLFASNAEYNAYIQKMWKCD